jgi:hypothetical protein
MKTDQVTYRRVARVVLGAALILMVPWLAMRVTDQMDWGLADFALAGALLVGIGLLYELAARHGDTLAYRAAVGVALAAALMLVWMNLAVGIIGSEDNPANLMYVGVLAVAAIGAVLGRFRTRGMAHAMFATAVAQGLVAAIALIFGLGAPGNGPLEILALNGFFAGLFTGSAWLFRQAAREEQTQRGAGLAG